MGKYIKTSLTQLNIYVDPNSNLNVILPVDNG